MASVVVLALPRARFAIPWLGLATVVVATVQAFSSSATLVGDGSIGVALGWVMTTIYGLIGLGIVLAYVQLRPVPFVPLGAIVAGLIYVASFYAYLPPLSTGLESMLVFVAPGFALVAYGAFLWHRHGLARPMEAKSSSLWLVMALGVVGLGAIGLLAYQSDRPSSDRWFANPPDLPRLATNSALAVEGVVIRKESRTSEYQRQSGRTVSVVHTLYQIEATHFWRGKEPGTVSVVVQDFSPVDLTPSVGNQQK